MNRRKFIGAAAASGFGLAFLLKAMKSREKPKYDVGTDGLPEPHPGRNVSHIELHDGGYITGRGKGKDLVLEDGKGNAISIAELARLRDE